MICKKAVNNGVGIIMKSFKIDSRLLDPIGYLAYKLRGNKYSKSHYADMDQFYTQLRTDMALDNALAELKFFKHACGELENEAGIYILYQEKINDRVEKEHQAEIARILKESKMMIESVIDDAEGEVKCENRGDYDN